MRNNRTTTAIASLTLCATLAMAPATVARAEGTTLQPSTTAAPGVTLLVPADVQVVEPTDVAVIGSTDGPTSLLVGDAAMDPMEALRSIDFNALIANIDTSDPKAYLDEYETQLDAGYDMLDEIFASIRDALVYPVGRNDVGQVPTHMTIVFPGKNLRLSFSFRLASSNDGVLRMTTYAPTRKADVDFDGMLLRDLETTPTRVETLAEGTARIVYTMDMEIAAGTMTRNYTRTFSMPMTVRADGNADGALGLSRLPEAMRENAKSALALTSGAVQMEAIEATATEGVEIEATEAAATEAPATEAPAATPAPVASTEAPATTTPTSAPSDAPSPTTTVVPKATPTAPAN